MGKIIMNGNTYGSIGSDVEANPQGTATDTLNTIGIDNVIYEIQGGGGGNVDDVYVNGASVLDSSHIAQITSYKEVTKAQYDAIPNKDNDNILYCIIDEGEVIGDNFNPIIYSLEEREVGTWIDGKPLYQRSYNIQNISKQDWSSRSLGLSVNDNIVNSFGQYITNNGVIWTIGYDNGSSFDIYFSGSPLAVTAYWDYGDASSADLYLTIQYTKTTDVPGSGQYTSLGVPAVHYSTDEQVIGTWIDGKTIYQKTYDIGSDIAIRSGQANDISNYITDIKDNVNNYICCKGHSDNYKSCSDFFMDTDGGVCLYTGVSINIRYLTIQYTKTTS